MKTMFIYEPALCCETGVCGVSVAPELLRISTITNNLKKHGITLQRYNLNNFPQEFVNNTEINKLINSEGVDALPATVVDGKIVKTKEYPTNGEIVMWLNIPASVKKLLPRLRNADETAVVIVTLAETTPVYEAMRLEEDLKRAEIATKWWVINSSLCAADTSNQLLKARGSHEVEWINKVDKLSNGNFAVIKWSAEDITGDKLLVI